MFRRNITLIRFQDSLKNISCGSRKHHSKLCYAVQNVKPNFVTSGFSNITSTVTFNYSTATSKNISPIISIENEADYNTFTDRTHTCGELRPDHNGSKVILCGWVQYVRLSKFILIRDAYGLTQCVVTDVNINISDIPLETVVKVEGIVTHRPKDMVNPKMPTGEVEVIIKSIEVLNNSDSVPFNLREYQKPKEQLRLQYRYIDLRFPDMQSNLRLRSTMLHKMRKFLIEKHGFVEVETPTLFCCTPGGAREFIVPTHHSGLFYSLVQSPQQFKQILMAGSVDRYFQVARCYRDETTRSDRQPEFTQLDIELSFTNQNSVLSIIEELLYASFPKSLPAPPFKRITYKDALECYGTDKPNLNNNIKLCNLSTLFSKESTIPNMKVFGLPYPNTLGKLSAKYKNIIRELSKKYSIKVVLNENISKEYGVDMASKIQNFTGQNVSMILAVGNNKNVCLCLGELREIIGNLLKSINLMDIGTEMKPMWVIDFPLFEHGDKSLETCHHPFTAPHPDDIHLLDSDPLKLRSLAYDLVMNGNEVGGGSVRIHNHKLQERILNLLNIEPVKLQHFLNALKSGCPPHAGIALGIDRLTALACDAETIRDVIAFPKSHEGKDPLSGAPNIISEEDKKYYHIVTVE